ncbi:unnamed protein product, partial [Coregonus sp. 'balchen']
MHRLGAYHIPPGVGEQLPAEGDSTERESLHVDGQAVITSHFIQKDRERLLAAFKEQQVLRPRSDAHHQRSGDTDITKDDGHRLCSTHTLEALNRDPMHGPQRLEVVDIKSKQITVRWEPFGYNVTRCHSYNLTVQYRYQSGGKEETREEVCYDTLSLAPQHTIRNLSPYTNVSVKLVLGNPEGVKESTDVDSIQGSTYEEKIALQWREPVQTYGIINQYEISYKALSSFDTEFDLSNQSGRVFKFSNETFHMFVGLYPGSTYSFTLRASTIKGFGTPIITQFTTKISGYDQETPLNQTDSTVTVLLKPAQSRGAPV